MTTHTLTITGGIKTQYVAGTCSCGEWSKFMNQPHRRGHVKSNKDFIKSEFKSHKASN